MTVTVFVLFVAVTLVPAGQAAMAACEIPASVDVFVAVTKVPVNGDDARATQPTRCLRALPRPTRRSRYGWLRPR